MKKQNHWLTLLSLSLVLSACGKNMSIPVAENQKGKIGGHDDTLEVKQKLAKEQASFDEFDSKTNLLKTEGEIIAIPAADRPTLVLPFVNKPESADDKNTVIGIGEEAQKGTKSALPYVKASNLVGQVEVRLPADKTALKKVTQFKLVLRGVTVLDAKDTNAKAAENQILCILSLKECSGQASYNIDEPGNFNPEFFGKKEAEETETPATPGGEAAPKSVVLNDLFAKIALESKFETLEDGAVIRGSGTDVEVDLLKAFDFSEDGAESVEDLYNALVPVNGKPTQRLLQIALGNNIYAKSARLVIESEADADKLPEEFKKPKAEEMPATK